MALWSRFPNLPSDTPAGENPIEKNPRNARGIRTAFREAILKASISFSGSVLLLIQLLSPASALAFSLPSLWPVAEAASPASESLSFSVPSSATPALKAAINADPNPTKGGSDLAIVGGVALLSESGPEGTTADITEATSSTQISIYVVRQGDSLAKIAKLFGVSNNTILWANNLKSASDISPGDTLVILPVSGVEHVVTKGETIASIVKKYKGDLQDFLDFNNLASGDVLVVGDTVIIPDGIDAAAIPPAPIYHGNPLPSNDTVVGCISHFERYIPGYGGPLLPGYFAPPLASMYKTQCLHGYNAVDLNAGRGTRVMAAAEGTVIVARSSGYNGGYGEYIVIDHPNGTQTVYGHLSKVYVSPGTHVNQGELIALSGNTGRSTGPHLHFEIRGAANPF